MSRRSNQVANFLRGLGVRRGERMLLMLPNIAPLWEVTLAAIKLGAVVSPATTLLTRADLQDRIERGRIKHVVGEACPIRSSRRITRIAVGGTAGWGVRGRGDARPRSRRTARHGRTTR